MSKLGQLIGYLVKKNFMEKVYRKHKLKTNAMPLFKGCVCYFLRKLYFSPDGSPSKTMKDVFYLIYKDPFILKIFKCLYFNLSLFFSLSAAALERDPK